ncbi:LacI family DNA-binding transcriptional regulator [Nanchangia anserum]|uniref:LacI family DNA-binding transcriptional regulator n=1 Tax=Nanchangia anserum TaxID=2692125 RepID=A0A8I0KTZ2_9ACTO|nr:LacI family DNA-binding transcriptional regulator [Nanchangia anserum]MBD3689138.1 LacI family DNA-binding transcriptional regulator [Nanchangia anserum]QOX81372.1 LacI family DNA-binding transcriptional regulator [Nanchangia anserum]
MAVTLADVAREVGVSTAAASMVLSGRYRGRVSEPRADAIRQAADRLNYVRNELALGLRTAQSDTIGFITQQVASTPYATTLIAAATETARAYGHLLIVIETDGDPDAADAAIRDLSSHQVRGVAYASMYHRRVRVPRHAGDGLIILDGYTEDPHICALVPDEVQGAHDAVAHLVTLGHRRVAFLNDCDSVDAAPLRRRGVEMALAEAGLALLPSCTRTVNTRAYAEMKQATRDILTQPDRPTAFFCYNDSTAIVVAQVAAELGLKIPDDLSLVGFDNFTTLIEFSVPSLTTVQLPHADMARWTITSLVTGTPPADGPAPDPGTARYRFPCPLIVRGTTAPPPA